MTTIHEPARDIPVYGQFDVVVCGGGPAGFFAATAAARAGASVLLIERYGFLGGTATAALVVEFGSMYDGRDVLVGGLTHEFMHALADAGGYMFDDKTHGMTFDPDAMALLCQEMALGAGVKLLLHTIVVDTLKDGDRVTGVVVENKSGRSAVLGKVVVDGTGDGDVAARAGAAFDIGHGRPDVMQPVTLEVVLGNVDVTRMPASHYDVTPAIQANASEWPIPTERILSWAPAPKDGVPQDDRSTFFFINVTNVLGVNGINADDLTRAEVESRRQVRPLVSFLRKHVSGFENCYADRVAAQVGIRETRRIACDYTLTREDVLAGRHFADGVAPSCNSIDVHHVDGKDFAHEYVPPNAHYQVPYRCFLPRGLDGLIVSGRCIGADHRALGSCRVMITVMPMGEACGLAAAMAVKAGVSPRKVDVAALREQLRAAGTILR